MKKLITIALLIVSTIGFSQNQTKRATEFNLEKKVAIQGYDPVAYFKQNKALKEIASTYDGVIYYFSSVENKSQFMKTPTKYEPQYGGWCAYAMGNSGDKVEINPETFKIIDGKLFLFYNAYFNNTLKSWNKNEAGLKAKADANWKKIIK
jgi:YHS domain-containing protein